MTNLFFVGLAFGLLFGVPASSLWFVTLVSRRIGFSDSSDILTGTSPTPAVEVRRPPRRAHEVYQTRVPLIPQHAPFTFPGELSIAVIL